MIKAVGHHFPNGALQNGAAIQPPYDFQNPICHQSPEQDHLTSVVLSAARRGYPWLVWRATLSIINAQP